MFHDFFSTIGITCEEGKSELEYLFANCLVEESCSREEETRLTNIRRAMVADYGNSSWSICWSSALWKTLAPGKDELDSPT
jgi:hypothetical protein